MTDNMQTTHDAEEDVRNANLKYWLNGRVVGRQDAVVSIYDSGFMLGDGMWEGMRLYDGVWAYFDEHIDRFFDSCKTVSLDPGLDRASIRAALEEDHDAEVVEAESGFIALRLLPQDRFDLVVLDVNMPDINGLELIRFLRQSSVHRTVPVLVVSTEASAKDRERGVSLGADAFLRKPFTAAELVERVRELRERS